MRTFATTGALIATLLCAGSTLAGPTPEQKCQAAKTDAAGKYAACRQKAGKSLALTGDATKYGVAVTKCATKFGTTWQKAIDRATAAGVTCLDAPRAAGQTQAGIDGRTDCVATAVGGGGLTTCTCGNGTIEQGEGCDFGTLGGQTCSSATAGAKPYGELACVAGCALDTSRCLSCPGAMFGGACWLVGAVGASCSATCEAGGLSYDPATATFAGSGGSDANCLALVSAVFNWMSPPAPPLTLQPVGASGFGCGLLRGLPPSVVRDLNPTMRDAADGQIARLCACH